jgi:cold shock CspA family protein
MSNERLSGIVIAYKADRGFGFITDVANQGRKLFFHVNEYLGKEVPVPGQQVTFEVIPYQTGKLPQAVNVE